MKEEEKLIPHDFEPELFYLTAAFSESKPLPD